MTYLPNSNKTTLQQLVWGYAVLSSLCHKSRYKMLNFHIQLHTSIVEHIICTIVSIALQPSPPPDNIEQTCIHPITNNTSKYQLTITPPFNICANPCFTFEVPTLAPLPLLPFEPAIFSRILLYIK